MGQVCPSLSTLFPQPLLKLDIQGMLSLVDSKMRLEESLAFVSQDRWGRGNSAGVVYLALLEPCLQTVRAHDAATAATIF